MKTLYTFLMIALCSTLLRGEAPEKPVHEPKRDGHRERGEEPPGRRAPPPVMDYLNQLKESDPEKFEEFQTLRREDPEAFRAALRQKSWQLRKTNGIQGHRRGHPLQAEIEKVRDADSPEAREAAVAALREKVAERVEKTQREREEAIEKIRRKLKQLEEQNEQERTRREEIIDQHLARILDTLTPQAPDE